MRKNHLSILLLGFFLLSVIGLQFHQSSSTDNSDVYIPETPKNSSEHSASLSLHYPIVDTGQLDCFNENGVIYPQNGSEYYGQDANYEGNEFNYTDNGDNTITDLTTGLLWQKDPGERMSWDDAVAGAGTFNLAGYNDWRFPTIKELYSLINFEGETGESADTSKPYINVDHFVFNYGDESTGERFIDSQYWTSTEYVSTTMDGAETVFGVNFADGRIKGYPKFMQDDVKENFVLYVRGNNDYGINFFVDNEDHTISDNATGLMWAQIDSGVGMNWQAALEWVQEKNLHNYLGYDDWRLPNIKELQSIVDYSRSPDTTDSAAINPIFNITKLEDDNWPFFWSSTTHKDGIEQAQKACYMAFGEARGFMETPPNSGNYELMDVHGAGAQRSDPKEGDPDDYPYGWGPQGDMIAIFNYIRLVRGGSADQKITSESDIAEPTEVSKISNFPLFVLIGLSWALLWIIERRTKKQMKFKRS